MSSKNGVSKDAFANSGTAGNLGTGYDTAASSTGSVLTPILQRMATSPTGYGQQDLNNMTTAAMQSYGGSQAGTVGQGNLEAARTNNAGGFQGAVDDSARTNAAGLSNAALGVQNQNAQLKQEQQREGIAGMQGLYGTDVGAGENALGLSDQALQVANAGKAQALQGWMAPFNVLASLGSSAGNVMQGIGAM